MQSQITTNVQPLFASVYNNLVGVGNLQSIFDTSDGMITGLNCGILSQDGVNVLNSLCVTSYNRVFFSLVTVGVLAFGLFGTLCCIICFGVRHSKSTKKFARILALDETSSSIKMG